jgi:uncharacterized membrane protein YkvA (DUF1232 family)
MRWRLLMLVWRAYRSPTVPKRWKLLLPAALAYLLSPIDLRPDFLPPVIGHMDDLVVLLLAVVLLIGRYLIEVPREGRREQRPEGGAPSPEMAIEGRFRRLDGA